jgi:hypothetical protein
MVKEKSMEVQGKKDLGYLMDCIALASFTHSHPQGPPSLFVQKTAVVSGGVVNGRNVAATRHSYAPLTTGLSSAGISKIRSQPTVLRSPGGERL